MYHAQNEIMNPNQEKKNTRPYMLTTLSIGTVLAFLLTGLIVGAFTRSENVKGSPILVNFCIQSGRKRYRPGRLKCEKSRCAGGSPNRRLMSLL